MDRIRDIKVELKVVIVRRFDGRQASFAHRAGCSDSLLSRVLMGERQPTREILDLAKMFYYNGSYYWWENDNESAKTSASA